MTLSKNKIKYIRSLDLKKNRKNEQLFLAEGPKLIEDLLGTFQCSFLAATPDWLSGHPEAPAQEVISVTQEELSRASLLKTPQQVLALFRQPVYDFKPEVIDNHLCLALDDVQDPGNLGTIIRLADWFGIEYIFCSPNSADVYNPKTVQATMGALARVKVCHMDLSEVIRSVPEAAIYGTFLDGENIYSQPLTKNGLIVMGNEGNGIGREVEKLINRKLYIPNYPSSRDTSESLNVAIATAIVCAEFRRRENF